MSSREGAPVEFTQQLNNLEGATAEMDTEQRKKAGDQIEELGKKLKTGPEQAGL